MVIAKDFDWFVENHDKLFKEYGHCFLAIKDERVLGAYSSYAAAVRETVKSVPLGDFIVEECTEDESGYTNYIASMGLLAF